MAFLNFTTCGRAFTRNKYISIGREKKKIYEEIYGNDLSIKIKIQTNIVFSLRKL